MVTVLILVSKLIVFSHSILNLVFSIIPDNLTLQENSRFIPVRPILRRNYLSEDFNGDTHAAAIGVVTPTTLGYITTATSGHNGNSIANPSDYNANQNQTINRNHHNHYQQHIQQQQQQNSRYQQIVINNTIPKASSSERILHDRGDNSSSNNRSVTPTGVTRTVAERPASSKRQNNNNSNSKTDYENKLQQIQEYIKITTSLIGSIESEEVNIIYFV